MSEFNNRFNRDYDENEYDYNMPTKTSQEYGLSTDINAIIRRYDERQLMQLHQESVAKQQYVDCTEIPDYQASMQIIENARQNFNSLPSPIRRRFADDPGEFLKFMSDPANHEEAVKMKLLPESVLKTVTEDLKVVTENTIEKEDV